MGTIITIVSTTLPALCGAALGAVLGHYYTMSRYKKEKEVSIEENLEPLMYVIYWDLMVVKKMFAQLKEIKDGHLDKDEEVKQFYENVVCNKSFELLDCEAIWLDKEYALFTYLKKTLPQKDMHQLTEILATMRILINHLQRLSKHQNRMKILWRDINKDKEKIAERVALHCEPSWYIFADLLTLEERLLNYEKVELFSYIKATKTGKWN